MLAVSQDMMYKAYLSDSKQSFNDIKKVGLSLECMIHHGGTITGTGMGV
jgi:hypothetical protein